MGKRTKKKTQRKKPVFFEYSKICVAAAFVLTAAFLIYICVEMHLQQNLEPVSYVGGGLLICLGIIVRSYMKRAHQKDVVNLEIDKTKQLSKLKEEHGDNFVYERVEDVNLDS